MIARLNFSCATEVIATAERYKGTKMYLIKFHKISKRVNNMFKQLNCISNIWLNFKLKRIIVAFFNNDSQMTEDIGIHTYI